MGAPRGRQKSSASPEAVAASVWIRSGQSSAVMSQKRHSAALAAVGGAQ